MKKINIWSLLLLCGALTFAVSCNKENFINERTEGLNLNIDADLLRVPVSLQILDAAGNDIPENITVEISGPGVDKIYSTVGERALVVNQGIIDFAIDKNETPTPENPIEFAVKVTAPGYVPTVQSYFIRDVNQLQQERIFMVNRAAPPAGVSTASVGINASAEGTADPVTVTTDTGTEVQEKAEITFPAGTQFFDAEGNRITGNISAQVAYFDNRSQESLDAFPGGFTAENVRDTEGNILDPVQFETAGFLAINLSAGSEEVRTFSQPIPVSMSINSETLNPETGAPVAAGDVIPLWSLDENTGEWTLEGTTTVSEQDGELKVDFEITHLSYYNLDWYYNICFIADVNIQSNITKIHPGTGRYDHYGYPYEYFKVTIYNAATDRPIISRGNFGPFFDGQDLSFFYAPDMDIYMEISRGSYWCSEVVYTSEVFNLCTVGTLDLNIPPAPERLSVNANISGVCSNAGRSIEIKPYAYFYYKKSNCLWYDWLGYFRAGEFVNNQLEIGETYDFAIYYSYDYYLFNDVTIENTTFEFDGQIFNVAIDANNAIDINMTQIPIPDEICDSFGF